MLKVLIVDDEEKICELIERLINWKELGLEVAGKVLNGLEAIEKIKLWQPEIVITDIRMPGISGIDMIAEIRKISPDTECIIISGYRHFEYAQTAIQYGVRNYLLKPIKKDELNASLKRIVELYREKHEQLSFEERVRMVMKNDEGKLRSEFMSSLLFGPFRYDGESAIEQINREYHFEFSHGLFQMAAFKIDHIEMADANKELMVNKAISIIQKHLQTLCYDMEMYTDWMTFYIMINYAAAESRIVMRAFRLILEDMNQACSLAGHAVVTIGLGEAVEGIHQLDMSLQSARRMIQQRMIRGTGIVISEELEPKKTDGANQDILREFSKEFERALESLEVIEVRKAIDQLRDNVMKMQNVHGYEIIQMTKEICNEYVYFMNSRKLMLPNRQNFAEQFAKKSEEYASVRELFHALAAAVCESFQLAADSKKAEDNRPVRVAKEYIQKNYAKSVTLEEVSQIAGFTPNYFTTVFKKETGQSFLEYLQEVRMEAAKKMLTGGNEPISRISESVGYGDVKYFTKCFIKYSGLKPGEYRKIYS